IGLLAGVAFALMHLYVSDAQGAAPWWSWPVFAGVLVVLASLCQALLTNMTYAEVSQLRPARWADGTARLPRTLLHIVLANVVVFGLTLTALVLLRQAPERFYDWYLERYGQVNLETYRDLVALAAFLGELLLWPVLAFGLLLSPLVVVEEQSAFRAL